MKKVYRVLKALAMRFRQHIMVTLWFAWGISLGMWTQYSLWAYAVIPVGVWLSPAHWKRPHLAAPEEEDAPPEGYDPEAHASFDDGNLPLDITVLLAQLHHAPGEVKPMIVAELWQRIYGPDEFNPSRSVRDLSDEVHVGLALLRSRGE